MMDLPGAGLFLSINRYIRHYEDYDQQSTNLACEGMNFLLKKKG